MTPQEWNFVAIVVEKTAARAYERGFADSEARKPMNSEQFQMSNGHLMQLKTILNKFLKKA